LDSSDVHVRLPQEGDLLARSRLVNVHYGEVDTRGNRSAIDSVATPTYDIQALETAFAEEKDFWQEMIPDPSKFVERGINHVQDA
jgi:hypothetical protein